MDSVLHPIEVQAGIDLSLAFARVEELDCLLVYFKATGTSLILSASDLVLHSKEVHAGIEEAVAF